ncbi:MAG: hypothetical protein R2746_00790 [Acidimicrobiales bacterium]
MLLASESSRGGNFASFDVELWQWGAFVALIGSCWWPTSCSCTARRTITFARGRHRIGGLISIGVAFTGVVVHARHGGQPAGSTSRRSCSRSRSRSTTFVWAEIFSRYFAAGGVPVPHPLLGIFGALVLRAIFIFAGIALIERFEAVLVVFGLVPPVLGVEDRCSTTTRRSTPTRTRCCAVRRFIPSTTEYDGQKLFTIENGKRLGHPALRRASSSWRPPTWSSPSTPCPPCSPCPTSSSSCSARTPSRSSACGRRTLLGGTQDKFRYPTSGWAPSSPSWAGRQLVSYFGHLHPPTWVSLVVIVSVLVVTITASLLADRRDDARAVG